jgi:putative ABC transport system permease protein
MLLPAINLINLINSRIMERASEIGIRKAFGASSSVLTQQFIVENVILTLFGGILSIVLAGLFMHYFNQNDMLAYARLSINWKVLLVAVVCSVVLGLLSGVYPAWRMSKLNVADVIRQSD